MIQERKFRGIAQNRAKVTNREPNF